MDPCPEGISGQGFFLPPRPASPHTPSIGDGLLSPLFYWENPPGCGSSGFYSPSLPFVIAAVVSASPIMIQAARAAFASVDRDLEDAGRTLGKGEWTIFLSITLPLARRTLLVGLALSAARAPRDFGVSLMVAGSMPGRTQTLPPLYLQPGGDPQLRPGPPGRPSPRGGRFRQPDLRPQPRRGEERFPCFTLISRTGPVPFSMNIRLDLGP